MHLKHKILIVFIFFVFLSIILYVYEVPVISSILPIFFMAIGIGVISIVIVVLMTKIQVNKRMKEMTSQEALAAVRDYCNSELGTNINLQMNATALAGYIGSKKLFGFRGVSDNGQETVFVVNAETGDVSFENFPTAEEYENPFKILVDDDFIVSPVREPEKSAFRGYFRRHYVRPRQAFYLGQRSKPDDLKKLSKKIKGEEKENEEE